MTRVGRLTLLCNAATAATRAGRFPLDEPIEPCGLDRRPPRLPRHDRCLTSPATRAIQTAAALHIDAAVDPALRDQAFGGWAGSSLDTLLADEPVAVDTWLRDPGAAPHGGESLLDLIGRVGAWLEQQRADVGPVLGVTHAAFIRAAVVWCLGAEASAFWRIDVAPLAVATFNARAGGWTLRSLGSGRD